MTKNLNFTLWALGNKVNYKDFIGGVVLTLLTFSLFLVIHSKVCQQDGI